MKYTLYLSALVLLLGCKQAQPELLVGFGDLLVPAQSTHIRSFEAQEVDGEVIKLRDTPHNQLRRDFDAQGYLISIRSEDESGQISSQSFTFDADHQLLDYKHQYPDHSIQLEQEAKDLDRIRYRFAYIEKDSLTYQDTFYEEQKDLVHSLFTQEGFPIQRIYRNSLRQITQFARYDQQATLSYQDIYVYEGKRLVSEAHHEGSKITVSTYAYTQFDEQGNWTERIKKLDGVVVAIEERSISYPPAP